MEPLLRIAADRRATFERTAATERLAAQLRRARPIPAPGDRRSGILARVAARAGAAAPGPAPCPTC